MICGGKLRSARIAVIIRNTKKIKGSNSVQLISELLQHQVKFGVSNFINSRRRIWCKVWGEATCIRRYCAKERRRAQTGGSREIAYWFEPLDHEKPPELL